VAHILSQSLLIRRFWSSQEKVRSRVALLFLNLDDFKLINDTLGHQIGDRVLVAVARRLKRSLREADTAARLGGDEFAVLLEDVVDASEAVGIAERFLRQLRAPPRPSGTPAVRNSEYRHSHRF
jgi:diguanylate cyclase (GGDEF)-like protein